MEAEEIADDIRGIREDVTSSVIDTYIPPDSPDEMWDIHGLVESLEREFGINLPIQSWLDENENLEEGSLREKIIGNINQFAEEKQRLIPAELMRKVEKDFMLDVLDRHWKEHLVAMDHLRQGIGLRSYAAKNPKQEYKREAFAMFREMLENIKHNVIGILFKVHISTEEQMAVPDRRPEPQQMNFNHPAVQSALSGPEQEAPLIKTPFVREQKKIGRNEPCPCGSGKKYKQCHGKLS